MIDFLSRANQVEHCPMYINGAWHEGAGRDRIEVENPATEQIIASIPEGTAEDAELALKAAKQAATAWALLPPIIRAQKVNKLADLIDEQAETLAEIVVSEQGKPLNQAQGEIGAAAMFLRYAAENARRIEGNIVPSDHDDEEIWIRRVPHGVVVGLTAWNYPAALATRKMGPALVAGNTFVLLSHEITPLSGLAIAELAHQAGFPPGVVNVVTGRGAVVGQALVESPLSDLITMTGSTRAGKQIYRTAAEQVKVISLELGGKAPFIVMDDADIDAAVSSAITARFTNCGQVCTCNERLYLHDKIADQFLDKFIGKVRNLSIAHPLSNPDLGPKVSADEVEKIRLIVEQGIATGATELLKGGALNEGQFEKGHWMAPSVLEVQDNQSVLVQQEIFGPVVPVMRFSDFEQSLSLANDSVYGLSAYLYSKDIRRLMNLTNTLNFGEIYFNRTNGELVQGYHGGWKQSGLGGEDGKYGFDGYLKKKTMYVNWG